MEKLLNGLSYTKLHQVASELRAQGFKTSWGTSIILGDAPKRGLVDQIADVAERNPELVYGLIAKVGG